MSDKAKTKTVKAARPRKVQVIMLCYYKPEGIEYKAFTDNLGRLPKGKMVEMPKKLADQLIERKIVKLA